MARRIGLVLDLARCLDFPPVVCASKEMCSCRSNGAVVPDIRKLKGLSVNVCEIFEAGHDRSFLVVNYQYKHAVSVVKHKREIS